MTVQTAYCWNCDATVEVAEGRCWECCAVLGRVIDRSEDSNTGRAHAHVAPVELHAAAPGRATSSSRSAA